jgi:serine/threonine-protein kinase
MYCPKCKESFEEGSRRFCPTDGARLISDTASPTGNQWEGGIFANLIPKIESSPDLDEAFPDIPRFVINEPSDGASFAADAPSAAESKPEKEEIGDDFFVLDDIETVPESEPLSGTPPVPDPVESKPTTRKINPYEIPAGHVELGGGDRLAVSSAEFQEENPESFIGRTVKGRYYVTELLGGEEGSFAFVADDKLAVGKKVLVRILLEDGSDEIMGSILDEERVSLAHLSHPNIARLIDSGQFTDRTRFLISEFVDALSVSDILSIHGMFGDARAARIIRQATYALNEVHQEGILHRDLRPANIIVTPGEGEAEQATLVNFGASNGEPTPHNISYKAPEVLDGRISTIASDIFSLAVVAYEMLTGVLPFNGKTEKEVLRSQYSGPDKIVTSVRPELPGAIDRVFERALAFNVADRYGKARDFGDAFYTALTEVPSVDGVAAVSHPEPAHSAEPLLEIDQPPVAKAIPAKKPAEPARPKIGRADVSADEPAWTRRSPEPPQVGNSRKKTIAAAGILALVALLAFGWYYIVNHPVEPELPVQTEMAANQSNSEPGGSPIVSETEMPPLPRNIPQPPNTNYYQNSKQNLKGDLLRNFVGFSMYYPKDWKVNGPQESVTANTRGKFLDISRSTPEGRLKEQMLISYYPSKGTFREDADKFPQMVKETNDTLKKLLPGYQMVSEGEIKINGDWRAYEVRFQGGGTSESGEKLVVWGRRLFIPAARPGVRDGFEITMLATSAADDVRSVDDVGVRGELAGILYSFEPSQNF